MVGIALHIAVERQRLVRPLAQECRGKVGEQACDVALAQQGMTVELHIATSAALTHPVVKVDVEVCGDDRLGGLQRETVDFQTATGPQHVASQLLHGEAAALFQGRLSHLSAHPVGGIAEGVGTQRHVGEGEMMVVQAVGRRR